MAAETIDQKLRRWCVEMRAEEYQEVDILFALIAEVRRLVELLHKRDEVQGMPPAAPTMAKRMERIEAAMRFETTVLREYIGRIKQADGGKVDTLIVIAALARALERMSDALEA